ncbi:MAG: hypothetical protein CMP10_19835 [Zetaproteobacteria bacterium]|nr:hypothetical protein [Pseudobdellovibrionaceae bacterium]
MNFKPFLGYAGILLGLLALAGLFRSEVAYGCSSCGTGGGDPLILYPAESQKYYLGASRQSGIKNINSYGKPTANYGPEVKGRTTLAAGYRLLPKAFVTLNVSLLENSAGSELMRGVGDPSLGGRWTILRQNFAQPILPQVQLLFGYQPGWARGGKDSESGRSLDVFGAGFDQQRLGLDLWWGMQKILFGGSINYVYSSPKRESVGVEQPGLAEFTNLTLGYQLVPETKILGGLLRQRTAQRIWRSQSIADSEIINHTWFATIDYRKAWGVLRLTLNRIGYELRQKNTVQSQNYTLAWMRAL